MRRRRKTRFRRRRPARIKGNRVRSMALQHLRRRRRRFGRRRRPSLSLTQVFTNSISPACITPAADIWAVGTGGQADFNVQKAVYSSGTLGPQHPYRFLYKQYRVKKILAYVRFINAPNSVEFVPSTDDDAVNTYHPIHWELFARASAQNDALVTDELKLASNKVSVTNDGRQYKFSVVPMVNYTLQIVKGDTQTPVGTNVKYYKPAGWIDMDDATAYQYKVLDVMNHSFAQVTTAPAAPITDIIGRVELNITNVFEFRGRKTKNIINDASGMTNAMAVGDSYLAAPGNVGLILNSPTDPGGA